MDVKYVSEMDWRHLNNYISSKKIANIYHSWEWKNTLTSTYNFTPLYLFAVENNFIKGFLPLFKLKNIFGRKSLISLPYSHMVPVLYDSPEACDALLHSAQSIAQNINAKVLMLKCDQRFSKPQWNEFSNNFISTLDLQSDINLIKKNIKNSTLRNIKKAKKENVKIEIGKKMIDYKNFYDLMVDTRRRQGAPPYPLNFFKSLYNNFEEGNRCLFQAFRNGQLLAGIIMLYFGDTAIYAYGASVSNKSLMRFRPNELLFWTAIKDACEKNYSVFDFGITPFYNKDLLHFKSRWGVKTYKIMYVYLSDLSKRQNPLIDRSSTSYRLASKFLTRLPRPIIKVLGPQLLKFIGY
ncbi:MAG: GNAT family N-acetyltransferase [Desulfobacterales bacterium]|nr:GNAT family N-acetyltransferase [Desulfobacterales bacterium]